MEERSKEKEMKPDEMAAAILKAQEEIKREKREKQIAGVKEPRIGALTKIEFKKDSIASKLLERFDDEIESINLGRYKVPYSKHTEGLIVKLRQGFNKEPEGQSFAQDFELRTWSSNAEVHFPFWRKSETIHRIKIGKDVYLCCRTEDASFFAISVYIAAMIEDKEKLYDVVIEYLEHVFEFKVGSVDLVGYNEVLESCRNLLGYEGNAVSNRHILLVGPPGCGKTMIVKQLVKEFRDEYLTLNITTEERWQGFIPMLADVVKYCKRKLLIAIDEIDEVGLNREVSRTEVYQMLRLMDGVAEMNNVKFIATTNRPQDLDAALLRVGRFGPAMAIEMPTKDEKMKILEYYLEKFNLPKLDLNKLKVPEDVSGATLRAAVEDCLINKQEATCKEIEKNIERIVDGEKLVREVEEGMYR